MLVLDSVSCADTFPADGSNNTPTVAALLSENGSNGGYFTVLANDVYVQFAFGKAGNIYWTPAVHVAPGNGSLPSETLGVRFRNYTAGKVAVVSAGLAAPNEPALSLTAAGVTSTVTVSTVKIPVANINTIDLVNTGAENSLLSGVVRSASTGLIIPAGTMTKGALVRMKMAGDYLNNSGVAQTWNLKLYVNASQVFANLFTGTMFGAVAHPWNLEVLFQSTTGNPVFWAVHSGQFNAWGNTAASAATSGNIGIGGAQGGQAFVFNNLVQGAGDPATTDLRFDATATHSLAAATVETRVYATTLEILQV